MFIQVIKSPNQGAYLQQQRKILRNDKLSREKTNVIKSAKSKSPTVESGATSLHDTESVFMNIETNGNNSATDDVCCSEEVTNFFQIGNIISYINRYSSPDSFPPELGN